MVSVETRAPCYWIDVPGREDSHLEHQQHNGRGASYANHPTQHLSDVYLVVAALQRAALHTRYVVAPSRGRERVVPEPRVGRGGPKHAPPTPSRAGEGGVGEDDSDKLAHGALVPEPAARGQRPGTYGPGRAQLPEPGRDDGVHDLPGGGGDEDVEGVGGAEEGGAEGECV